MSSTDTVRSLVGRNEASRLLLLLFFLFIAYGILWSSVIFGRARISLSFGGVLSYLTLVGGLLEVISNGQCMVIWRAIPPVAVRRIHALVSFYCQPEDVTCNEMLAHDNHITHIGLCYQGETVCIRFL